MTARSFWVNNIRYTSLRQNDRNGHKAPWVNYRVEQPRKGRTESLSWNLPYEIIIVGVYDSVCEKD